MTRYLIILEHGPTSYGAYSPDVPGCFAVGKTPEETLKRMQEALQGHIDTLKQLGEPAPLPATQSVGAIDANSVAAWVVVAA